MSKRIQKLIARFFPAHNDGPWTQLRIDGAGEHRRKSHWTIFQMRNGTKPATDYRRAEH